MRNKKERYKKNCCTRHYKNKKFKRILLVLILVVTLLSFSIFVMANQTSNYLLENGTFNEEEINNGKIDEVIEKNITEEAFIVNKTVINKTITNETISNNTLTNDTIIGSNITNEIVYGQELLEEIKIIGTIQKYISQIVQLVVESTRIVIGEIINISAKLIYVNESPIIGQDVGLYYDSTLIETFPTNEEGDVIFSLNTSGLEIKTYDFELIYGGSGKINGSSVSWEFEIISDVNESDILKQKYAEINKPVKWEREIILGEILNEIVIEVPERAYDVNAVDVNEKKVELIEDVEITISSMAISSTEEIIFELEEEIFGVEGIKKFKTTEEIEEIVIRYMTLGPEAEEVKIEGKEGLKIKSDIHYKNVSSYMNFTPTVRKPKLVHYNNGNLDVTDLTEYNVKFLDTDEDGLYDYVKWITPGLSEQIFLIEITMAEHLDSSRTFISDIYDAVKELDGLLSPTINNSQYVRIMFEKNLSAVNDITIYVTNITSFARVKVYEKNKSEKIADFGEVIEGKNKIYLDNLNGEQDTFDLKIVNGSLQFDWIVDPVQNISSVILNSSSGTNYSDENLTAYVSPLNNSQKYIYDWKVDNNSIAILNIPMDGGETCGVNYTCNYGDSGEDAKIGYTVESHKPTYNSTGGYDGKGAYSFDGVDDAIYTGSASLYNFERTDSFSLEAYFKSTDSGNNNPIFSNLLSDATFKGYELAVNSGGAIEFKLINDYGGSNYLSAITQTTGFYDGNFHHVFVSYDGSSDVSGVNIYVDGNLMTTTDINTLTGTITGTGYGLHLGNRPTSLSFNGIIDEVKIWNREVFSEQVSAIYNNQTDLIVSNETNVGENWSVMVTPVYAGEVGSSVLSNNLSILAVVPTIDSVVLNSSSGTNFSDENLTAYVSPLNNSQKYIYDWKVDGSSINILNLPMDGGLLAESGTKVRDYINGYNATVTGATYNSTGGYDGKGAYEFNGVTQYLTISDNADLTLGGSASIELWGKKNSNKDFQMWVTKGSNGYQILDTSTTGKLGVRWGGDSLGVESTSALATDEWYHIVVTYDQSYLYLYINGVLNNSAVHTTNANDNTNLFYVGRRIEGYYFDGTLDEVKLYNRSLSAEQVNLLYSNRSDIIFHEDTHGDEVWEVSVTPNNNIEEGATILSNNLTVKPLAINVTLNSTSGTNLTNENLTLNILDVSHHGSESDKYFYNWKVDGSSIGVLNMPFDGNLHAESSTKLRDYIGGHNASVNGAGAVYNSTGGYDGKGAYEFDSSDSYLQSPDSADFTLGSAYTVMAWIKPDAGTGDRAIFGTYNGEGFIFALNTNDHLNFWAGESTGIWATSSYAVTEGSWSHVAYTKDNYDVGRFYVNGAIVATVTGYDVTNGGLFDIGVGGSSWASQDFRGTIDEVKIFKRALSSEQISAIHNNQTNLIVSSDTRGGEVWSVETTPNNNLEDRNTVISNNLTIEYLGVSVSLNSSSGTNLTDENLTANAFNANNGFNLTTDKAIYNWKVDGNSIAVLNLPMDGDLLAEGNTKVKDYSYGNNGTVTNAVYNSTGGYDGKGAYDFDGSGDYITIPHSAELDLTTSFSIEARVRVDGTGSCKGIVSKYQTAASFFLRLDCGAENKFNFGGNTGVLATSAVSVGEWYHVVGVEKDGIGYLYINGVLNNSGAVSISSNSDPVRIGIGFNTASRSWDGIIDEVKIYDRSLTAEQVSALYNNQTNLIVSGETSFGNIWSADVTPNNNVEDGATVSSNNLTVSEVLAVVDLVDLNSSSGTNLTTENLTAHLTNLTPEGAKAIYDWKVDVNSITGLNMPMDGGLTAEGNTKVKDYSYGNNGTVTNAVYNSTGGYDGKGAYDFDGNGDYINIPHSAELDLTTSFSIEARVRVDGTGSCKGIVSKYQTASSYFLRLNCGSGDTFNFGGDTSVTATSAVSVGEWYHVVAVEKGGIGYLYINGVLNNSGAVSISSNSDPVRIGMGYNDIARSWNGIIDEVKIYDRSLTAEQVSALYNNQTNLIVSGETRGGEVWSSQVIPHNNFEDGAIVTSNDLTIESLEVSINLNSTLGTDLTNENLTANILSTSGGFNETVDKVIYNWKIDGTPFAVLNLPMDGGLLANGGARVKDYSYGNNGVVTGTTINYVSTGGYDSNGAYNCSGVNGNYISFSSSPSVSEEFTMSTWIKREGTGSGSNNPIFDIGNYNSNNGFGIWIDASNQIGWRINQNYNNYKSSVVPALNTWTNIVINYNGTSVKIYSNGVEVTNDSVTTGPTPLTYYMRACARSYGNEVFKGLIDEVMVYNRSLSDEQILAIYNNQTNLIVSNETDYGETWTVDATPNNNVEDGTTVTSNNLVILTGVSVPTITLDSPTNNSKFNLNENITLRFTPTSNNLSTCSLYGDWNSGWHLNQSFGKDYNDAIVAYLFETTDSLADSNGNYNLIVEAGSPTYSSTGGYDGKGAYYFSGNERLGATSGMVEGSGDFTYSIWVKTDSAGTSGSCVIGQRNSPWNGQWCLGINENGKPEYWDYNNGYGYNNLPASNEINDSLWRHVVFIRSGTTGSYYIDGTWVNNVSGTLKMQYDIIDFAIGESDFGDGDFVGWVDDVFIFNKSLNTSQIEQLYQGTYFDSTFVGGNQQNYTLFNFTEEGIFNWGVKCDDTFGIESWAPNNYTFSVSSIVVSDIVPVSNLVSKNLTNMEIGTNVSTVVGTVDTAKVNITLPNSTVEEYILTNTESVWYNMSYSPYEVGQYNLSFWANNSLGDIAIATSDFYFINMTLNSTTGNDYMTDNLTTHILGYSNDKVIYDWKLGGNSIAVLNMPFDKGLVAEGNTKVRDYSDNANNGTVINAIYNSTGGYDSKGAYLFDGYGDYIEILNSNEIDLTNNFAIEARVRVDGTGACKGIASKYQGIGANSYFLRLDCSTGNRFDFGGATSVIGTTTVSVGEWYHVVGVEKDGIGYIYVNGVLENSNAVSIASSSHNLIIGVDYSDASRGWNGIIDEVKIYNRALSIEQINALYNNRTDLIVSEETIGTEVWTNCATFINNNNENICSNSLTVLDVSNPSVFDLVPTANTNYNVSDVIEIGANVTDDSLVSAVLANITYPNGTVNQLTLTNLSDFYNNSFTIPNLIGQYNITFIANDTSNNLNVTETTFFVGIDSVAPSYSSVSCSPTVGVINATFNCSAIWTDNVIIDTVLANVTMPNGTITEISLSASGENYSFIFNLTEGLGDYNITWWANDTSSLENTTLFQFQVSEPAINVLGCVEDPIYTLGVSTTCSANVQSIVNPLDGVLANVTLPNGTVENVVLTNISDVYSFTFINTNIDGIYNISWTANESTGLISTESDSFTVSNDSVNPSINITSPTNNTKSTNQTLQITFNITDNLAPQLNYTIYVDDVVASHNGDGTITNDSEETVTLLNNLALGVHLIKVEGIDLASNSKNSSILYINITSPTVELFLPADNQTITSTNYNFTFSVNDATFSTLNCSLLVNGTLESSNALVIVGANTSLEATGLSEGINQQYTISCINPSLVEGNTTRVFNVDVTNPIVTIPLYPVAESSVDIGTTIIIGANVTDNQLIANVTANITYPNSTVTTLILTEGTSGNFTNTFVVPNLSGVFTILFFANDSGGNINNTTTTNFTTVDGTNPLIFNLVPTANTNYNVSEQIEIGADITDNVAVDTVLANITYPNGTVNQLILTLIAGNWYNDGFNIPGLTGQYNVTFIANDTTGNFNITETTYFVGVDSAAPTYSDVSCNPSVGLINATFNCSAVWIDNVAVDTVSANVTMPNGTVTEISLSQSGDEYSFEFNVTGELGIYNISWWANDTNSFENTTISQFQVSEPEINVSGCSEDPVVSFGRNTTCSAIIQSVINPLDTVLANVTMPNGTVENVVLTNVSDVYSFTFNNTNLNGVYNISWTANTSTGLITTGSDNFTVVNDYANPSVFDLVPIANANYNFGSTIEIGANVTDDSSVNAVLANITYPNGTVNQLTLTLISNNWYNVSYTIPTLIGQYNITFIANDTLNNLNTTETTYFNSVDTSNPSVFNLIPTSNTNYNVSDVIEIGANVTDNVAVDTVLANITYPNGTVNQLTLTNLSDFYNNSFTIPNLIGQYNITFIANDSSSNLNVTQTSFFVGVESTNPSVFNLIPTSNTNYNVSDVIEIGANVTDNVAVEVVLANITYPNGTVNQLTLTNLSDFYNNSFTIPNLIGQYNITFIANDTSNNLNITETTYFVGVDTQSPSVFNLIPTSDTNYTVTNVIEIGANVTDNVAVDTVLANITYPNSTVVQLILTNLSEVYNNSFTIPNLVGRYNITYIANDTSGNLNTTQTTYFTGIAIVVPSINFTQPTENSGDVLIGRTNIKVNVSFSGDNATIYLYNSTKDLVNSSIGASSPYFFNFTDLNAGVYYFNATTFNSGSSNSTLTRNILISAEGSGDYVLSNVKISDGLAGFNPSGLSSSDRLGTSVANIGDLDGDGIQDLAVGARSDENTQSSEGAVYILFLNIDGTVKSNVKISDGLAGFNPSGLDGSDYFGTSVANIGDLDGDGIQDLAVGAYNDENTQSGEGAVYILFMNSDGNVKDNVKISDGLAGFNPSGLGSSDRFGTSVSDIGDLDGDGIQDLAVGARSDENSESSEGAVYILFMNTNGSVKSNVKISDGLSGFSPSGLDSGDYFGRAITKMGDLDGDGVQDLAVGAYNDENTQSGEGAVYILFMNTDGTVKSNVKISDGLAGFSPSGLDSGDYFGTSVANMGDLDSDGVQDLAVGVYGDENIKSSEGAVYILFMNTDGTVKSNVKISDGLSGFSPSGLDSSDRLGSSVTNMGDLDGDGIQDLAVGAYADENTQSGEGAVYILSMGRDPTIPTITITSPSNNTVINGNVSVYVSVFDNLGIGNVLFEIKNSTTSYSTLCNETVSPYICNWVTADYSDGAEGYDVRATVFDTSNNNASEIRHYVIDRDIPYSKDISVTYPTNQTSVRDSQEVILKVNVSDSTSSGAGINTTRVDLTSLNTSGNVTMDFEFGSLATGQWSLWNKTVNIGGVTGDNYALIHVSDNATPTNNIRSSDQFYVYIDNDYPSYNNMNVSETYDDEEATFRVNVTDNYEVNRIILSTNFSGSWSNETALVVDTITYQASFNKFVANESFGYKFYIFDDAGNMNETVEQIFTPLGQQLEFTVLLLNPVDTNITTSQTINFTYKYYNGTATNCSLVFDDVINVTTTLPENDTTLNFTKTLSDGEYNWRVDCVNNATNVTYQTTERTLTIDSISPTINISYPTNITYDTTIANLNFSYTEMNLDSCFYTLDNGVTNISNQFCANLTDASYSQGENALTVYVIDTAGNVGSDNVTFTIDTENSPYDITLISLANNTLTSNTSLTFMFNVTSDVNLKNATLYVWNSTGVFGTNTTNISGVFNESSLSLSGFVYGDYIWNVLVYDNAGGSNWSVMNWSFTILPNIDAVILNSTSGTNLTTENLTAYPINLTPNDAKIVYIWKNNFTDQQILYVTMDGGNLSFARDYVQDRDVIVMSGGAIQYDSTGGFNGLGTYVFDNDDYLNINPDINTPTGANWSISLWFNSTAITTSTHTMFADGSSNSLRQQIQVGQRSDTGFLFCGTYGDDIDSSINIQDNLWHNVVCSFDDSTKNLSLYLDGAPIGSKILGGSVSANGETVIGARPDGIGGFTDYWQGNLDEVMYWNRTLTQDMITLIANNNGTLSTLASSETQNNDVWQVCGTPNDNFNDGGTVCSNNLTITSDMTPPEIRFINSTPANATTQVATNVEINISIIEENLNEVKYDWNGTNFTMYNDSLVLMMNFDNVSALGENETYVVDMSGNGNNGTAYNGTTFTSSGKYGGAYEFDGVDDFMNLTTNFNLGTSDYTISTWINLDSVSEGGSFVKIGDGNSGVGIGVGGTQFDNNGNNLIILYELQRWVGTNSNIGTGWHHVALIVDSNGFPEAFIDGVSVYSDSLGVPIAPTNSINIGGYDERQVDATIDEVRIWNRSLKSSEIYQEYISNLNKFNSTQWYIYVNQSLNATDGLIDGDYTYFVSATDSSGNENITEKRTISINTVDTTPPTFTTTPANTTINYTQGFGVDFDATDETGFDSYAINWTTNFHINNSGYLENTTTLAVGTYLINLTINDTSNNLNSIIYEVVVNQAAGNVTLYLNNSESNVSITTGDSIWLNSTLTTGDSGNLYLYNNGTLINNGTSPVSNLTTFSSEGLYNISAYYVGNENYTSDWSSTWFVNVTSSADITYPAINFMSQTTASGNYSQTTIRTKVEALDSNLDTITSYIYNSSGLVNSTTSISSPLDFIFINLPEGTYYLNATANDTAGNTNSTTTRTIVLDATSPQITMLLPTNGFNTTLEDQNFTFNVTDVYDLNCTLYMDQIGSIGNVSVAANSSVVSGINTTFNVSDLANRTHSWFVTCSDPAGNSNSTAVRTLTVDQVAPVITITTPQEGDTLGYNVYIYTEISDALVGMDTATYYMLNASNTSQQFANGSLNSTNNWDAVWNSSSYSDAEWNVIFKVIANDSLGNEISLNNTFTLDNINPAIQLVTPPANTLYYNSDFSLNVIVQDFSLNYTNFSISNISVVQSNSTSYPNNITIHTWQDLVNFSNYDDGTYNATFYGLDGAGNSKITSTLFIVDTTSPVVIVNSPIDNLRTDATSITFNWTATDNLASTINCNLSVNDNFEQSDISCTNSSACTYTLGGFTWADYTWNVTCWDNATNVNNPTGNAFVPDWNDEDNDDVHNLEDRLIGDEDYVIQNGTTSLDITVGGESNLTTFNGLQEILFYDDSNLVINFTHNFTSQVFDLNDVSIKTNSSYVLVNLSNQLQNSKILYITDNNFIDLCVKDAEVNDISEMTADCSALDETNFSSCIGNSSGVTIGGIVCTDEGSSIKIENLLYSAIRGTIKESTSTTTDDTTNSGSGGGRITNCGAEYNLENGKCVEAIKEEPKLNLEQSELKEEKGYEIDFETEIPLTRKNNKILIIVGGVLVISLILFLIFGRARARARVLRESNHQAGKSNRKWDLFRRALAPGKRISKYGNIYYEYRRNRSDIFGKLSTIMPFGRKYGGRKRKNKNRNSV